MKTTDFKIELLSDNMTNGKTVKKGDFLNCKKLSDFNFHNGRVHSLKDLDGNIYIRRVEIAEDFIYLKCDNPKYEKFNLKYTPETIQQDFTEIALVHSYDRIL